MDSVLSAMHVSVKDYQSVKHPVLNALTDNILFINMESVNVRMVTLKIVMEIALKGANNQDQDHQLLNAQLRHILIINKKNVFHAQMDAFRASIAIIALNVDQNTTMIFLRNYAVKNVAMDLDFHFHVMTVTMLMEMVVVVIVR
eukprot:GHVR01182581.1.p1 GENE.GHVR01182581.1~~GHVR01182581.1.p1  ORF type:complete len:144 (-),score=6.02 GHVR01182581.1:1707-2138(-)